VLGKSQLGVPPWVLNLRRVRCSIENGDSPKGTSCCAAAWFGTSREDAQVWLNNACRLNP